MQSLSILPEPPFRTDPRWAGLFTSRGVGRHDARTLTNMEHEIIFVRSGELHLGEEDEEFVVRPDEALVLWPNCRHCGLADYAPDLRYYWIHFYCPATIAAPDLPSASLSVPKYGRVARPDVLETYFRRFLNDAADNCLSPYAAGTLIGLMLSELAAVASVSEDAGSAKVLAGRALAYIQSHRHLPLTASSIADAVHCSPGYLSSIFSLVYGKTLTDAIHFERIDFAQRLLLATSRSVDEIALDSGFANTSYFIKIFKRHTGMTALAYRRLYARQYINMEYSFDKTGREG